MADSEEPTTVYLKGDHYTVKLPKNSKLEKFLKSEAFSVLPTELKESNREFYEKTFSVEVEEVADWLNAKFQSSVADWLKTNTPPVTEMRAVLRFVTLNRAKELSSYEEHEKNRKNAGYTIQTYLDLVKPGEGQKPILSSDVTKKYGEVMRANKAAANDRFAGTKST